MAREKGMGSLQREKSGRWTVRVCVGGKHYSRSARTTDRKRAEAFLQRFLQPFGLGEKTIPLTDVWREYEKSPARAELAVSTLRSKRQVWMQFASWIEENHPEITQLKMLNEDAVGEFLRAFRANHTASTYNSVVCVLREICRIVSDKAGIVDDPWCNVRLLPDDVHSRRELSSDELGRLMDAAVRAGDDWRLLFCIGAYTGLRLGDCCNLEWAEVFLERGIIQAIPEKTKKHMHGRPVTIPIHPDLLALLIAQKKRLEAEVSKAQEKGYVIPDFAKWYRESYWRIGDTLAAIFRDAGIQTSVVIAGRTKATPDATFHSLRHTFVSFAANAGVPLPVVQSIVGHTSTAMTRHYYHENEDALRAAVAAIPSMGALRSGRVPVIARREGNMQSHSPSLAPSQTIEKRLKQLEKLYKKRLVTEEEYNSTRARILSEL